MPEEHDDIKLHMLIDGELDDDERRMLEYRLEGDEGAVRRLHRLLQVRDVMRELPRRKAPTDIAARLRSEGLYESEPRSSSGESILFGTLARVGAIAAALALVFFLVFDNGSNENARRPDGVREASVPVESIQNPMVARKASTSYDIIENGYRPELHETKNGITVEAGKDFRNSVTLKITDPASQSKRLREIVSELGVNIEYKPGHNRPVYLVRELSGELLVEFLDSLKEIDPELEVSNVVEFMYDGAKKSGSSEAIGGTKTDIHLLLKFDE